MMHFNKMAKASLLLLTACFSTFCEAATVFPPTPMGTSNSNEIAVAADNNNDAVAVFTNSFLIDARYSPGNQTWQPSVTISGNIGLNDAPDVAMDASSTALAVWRFAPTLTTNAIQANTLVGGTWGLPVNLEGVGTDLLGPPSVAMNGSGGGVAAWANTTLSQIHASFFSGGVWAPFTVIGTSASDPKVTYSSNGNAAAAWIDGPDIYTVVSLGMIWQSFTIIDSTGVSRPNIGTDASGHPIVVWSGNNVGDILWSRYDGVTWSAPQTISVVAGNSQPFIAVAPNGNAVAVWQDGGLNIQLSQFNGTSWTVPTLVAPGALGTLLYGVTMDSNGNALVGWVGPANQVFNAFLPLGGSLGTPVLISTETEEIVLLDLALSSGPGEMGVSGWVDAGGDLPILSFAALVLFAPTPPTAITGTSCVNKFASQSDRVHIINWSPSTDPTVVAYNIYRNGALIGIVPASGPFTFVDHCRVKGVADTYTVSAVNSGGVLSTPVTITLD